MIDLFKGKSNHHSGGVRIRKELGLYNSEIKGWYNQKEILQIFVSIFNVDLYLSITTKENILNKGLIAYLEYAAFAEFFEYCNGKPKFNKQ